MQADGGRAQIAFDSGVTQAKDHVVTVCGKVAQNGVKASLFGGQLIDGQIVVVIFP
jgi:hypothetical protein